MIRLWTYHMVGGRVDGIVLRLVGITQRRIAEDALRVSEARYRAMVEGDGSDVAADSA